MPERILKSDTWRASNNGEDRKEEFDREENLKETDIEGTGEERKAGKRRKSRPSRIPGKKQPKGRKLKRRRQRQRQRNPGILMNL